MKLQVGLDVRLYFVLFATIVLSASQAFAADDRFMEAAQRVSASDHRSSEEGGLPKPVVGEVRNWAQSVWGNCSLVARFKGGPSFQMADSDDEDQKEESEREGSDESDCDDVVVRGSMGEELEACKADRVHWRDTMKAFGCLISEVNSSDDDKRKVGTLFRKTTSELKKDGNTLLSIQKGNERLTISILINVGKNVLEMPHLNYSNEGGYIVFTEVDGLEIANFANSVQEERPSDTEVLENELGPSGERQEGGSSSPQGLWSRFSTHIGPLCGTLAMFGLAAKKLSDGSEDSRLDGENSLAATSSLVDSNEEVSISGIDKVLGKVEKVLDETGVGDSSQSKDLEVLGVGSEVEKVTAQDRLVLPGLGFMSDGTLSTVKKTALASVLTAGVLKLFHYCYSQYKKNSGLYDARGKAQMWAKKALYYAQQYKKMTMATAGGLAVVGLYFLQK